MKSGFLTTYSEERIIFAKNAGFDCVALITRPGSSLDTLQGGDSVLRAKSVLESNGIHVSALAYYQNHLETGRSTDAAEYLNSVIELAPRLGCPMVSTSLGWTEGENSLSEFKRQLDSYARAAQLQDVKLALRNVHGWADAREQSLPRISREDWDRLLDSSSGSYVGLELDPEALRQQGEDYLAYISHFGSKIVHVVAKDVPTGAGKVKPDGVDWERVFTALRLEGYAGAVDLELEERSHLGANFDESIYLGQKYLSQYLA